MVLNGFREQNTNFNDKVNGIVLDINHSTLEQAQILTYGNFREFECVELYLSCWSTSLPCVKIYPNKGEKTHCVNLAVVSSGNLPCVFAIRFDTDGRYFTNVKIHQFHDGSWIDISSESPFGITRIIGYK